VLNSVKHNVDDIYALPDSNIDPKLTELLATTLGFKVKRNYDQTQLQALVVVLPRILKYKGTKVAIDIAGRAILAASGASGSYRSEVLSSGELLVTFPETLVDISLFNDLLTYILPAGMTCHIERSNMIESALETKFDYNDKLIAQWLQDIAWDDEKHLATGLAGMFDVPAAQPIVANYITDVAPNIGLLDNNVIPMLNNNTLISTIVPAYKTEENDSGTTVVLNKYKLEENDDGSTVIIGEKNKL
jgi:hypothetical protein